MKRFLFLLTFPAWLLVSCGKSNAVKQSILTSANLKSLFITLNADSNYVLRTPKGTILKIAKNSFDVGKNVPVKLEIKEAYTIQDILLAGLSTESNGKLLKSGGMIYVNATANGDEIKLLKPMSISIPGEFYDDSMQLFKGELKNDSSINWVDPQPLDSSAIAKQLARGKALFKANCASCHKLEKDFTGPALKGWRNRVPGGDWIYKYIANPYSMQQTDPYARALLRKWNSQMTAFPLLGKDGVDAIMTYVDNEEGLNSFPGEITAEFAAMADSTGKISNQKVPCGFDTIYTKPVDTTIKVLSFNDIQPDTIPNSIDINKKNKPEDYEGLRKGFTDPNPTSGMYDFEIDTFGWYNVDAFVEGYDGTENVKINVQLQMQFESDMHVYLFCPDRKMLSVAYDHNKNNYWFNKNGGTIPLFLDDKAIILAFGSKADKLYYGVAPINIKAEQTINIQIRETTEEVLKSLIKHNNIDGIKIDLYKKEEFNIIEIPCNGSDSAKEIVIAKE